MQVRTFMFGLLQPDSMLGIQFCCFLKDSPTGAYNHIGEDVKLATVRN